jgi:hypothetical protein
MPKPNPIILSPLHQYYTTSQLSVYKSKTEESLEVKRSIIVDRTLFSLLSALANPLHPGFPALPSNWERLSPKQNLVEIDALIQVWLNSLPATAASGLLNQFKQYSDNPRNPMIQRLWTNYYMNICHIVVLTIWQYIPEARRTTEKLDSLIGETYALFRKDKTTNRQYAWSSFPNQMLRKFDTETSPRFNRHREEISLVEALNAYSYSTIKYRLYSILREGEDPYAGLRPLGILTNSRTTYGRIEQALRSVDLLRIVQYPVNHRVKKKYPNLADEGLKKEINQELADYLSGSIEEQFQRCRFLVKSLKDHPLKVHELVKSSFSEIGDECQKSLKKFYKKNPQQLPVQLSQSAVIILLESIGTMVRQYVDQVKNPSSIQQIIGGEDNDMTQEDIFIDTNQSSLIDDVHGEILSENFLPLYRAIHRFCQLPSESSDSPSHQQMLYLQYLLELDKNRIGFFLHIRFDLTDNAGSAAARGIRARTALVRSIQQEMNSSEPLNEDAVELIINVLKSYFPIVRRQLLSQVATQMDITIPATLIDSDRTKFIDLTTIEIEQISGLNLRDNIWQIGINNIVDKFLNTDT